MQGSNFPTPLYVVTRIFPRGAEKTLEKSTETCILTPSVVLTSSLLVAFGALSVISLACAVLAWSNGQPAVIRGLRDSMQQLEADRVVWLQRMDSYADAARHDLAQSADQRRRSQNAANRNRKADQAPAANGPPVMNEDAVIAQAAEYWHGR